MPSDKLDPKLEATTQAAIRESKQLLRAIVREARGSGRDEDSIVVSLAWPSRLQTPLAPQIALRFPARPRFKRFPNEIGALGCYFGEFLIAEGVVLGRYAAHGRALVNGQTCEQLMSEISDALFRRHEEDPVRQEDAPIEIPGIDLIEAAALIRLGSEKKVPPLRIAHWMQQELPFDAIVAEIKLGGIPNGYPVDRREHGLGGHGARIAELFRFTLDSDSDDLSRIATRLETPTVPRDGLQELFWLFGKSWQLQIGIEKFASHGREVMELIADMETMHPIERESADVLTLEASSEPELTSSHGGVFPSPLHDDEEENAEARVRKRLIREAVKQRLTGKKYCAFLDRNGLATSLRLQKNGCPPTYAAAYKSPEFRKSIQDEKTKVGKPSSRN